MNIRQDCLLELLRNNDHDYEYVDNHFAGRNIYYFGSLIITLTESCLSDLEALDVLNIFQIINPDIQLAQLNQDCQCNN